MSARTDELGEDQYVAIDVVMEALSCGRATAYMLAKQEKWRTGGGGYRFGDVIVTYARRKAEKATKRTRTPRLGGLRGSSDDTPR